MANIPTSNIERRFYFMSSTNVINEISKQQDKDKCGKHFGYKYDNGAYKQYPDVGKDGEKGLSGSFPCIQLKCIGYDYDDDGNEIRYRTEIDEEDKIPIEPSTEYTVYLYLDNYIYQGDTASNTGDDDLPVFGYDEGNANPVLKKSFTNRHKDEWQSIAQKMLLNGTNINLIRGTFPKYFTSASFTGDDLPDYVKDILPYRATAKTVLTLEQYYLLMWEQCTGEGEEKSCNYITDVDYMRLSVSERSQWVLRKETENYPQSITNKFYESLTEKEQGYYTKEDTSGQPIVYDVTKSQVVTVQSVNEDLVFLDDESVKEMVLATANAKAKIAVNNVLRNSGLTLQSLTGHGDIVATDLSDECNDANESDSEDEKTATVPNFGRPNKKIMPRYYFMTNGEIYEISSKQDKYDSGVKIGFDNSGQQLPEDMLKTMFPNIEVTVNVTHYDEDGDLDYSAEKDTALTYYYLDKCILDGDSYTDGKFKCNPNVHDYDCNTFCERFMNGWKETAKAELVKGTDINTIINKYPPYFSGREFTESATREVTYYRYYLNDGLSGYYPASITVSRYNSLSDADKALYEAVVVEGVTTGYNRKNEYTKSSYSKTIKCKVWNGGTLNSSEKALYHKSGPMTMTVTQTGEVEADGVTTSEGVSLVFLDTKGVKELILPVANQAATKAANKVVEPTNFKICDGVIQVRAE